MKRIIILAVFISQLFFNQHIFSQEEDTASKIASLKSKKELVVSQEKEALKKEVIAINTQLNKGEITSEKAAELKQKAADKHALNIENKVAIIDNTIALLERGDDNATTITRDSGYQIMLLDFENGGSIVTFNDFSKKRKYDKRTHSNLVTAFGFNNAIIEGQSIDDSPYKMGKSKFFELGWVWTTRVLNNSNAVRFKYGLSFTFNGLNPIDNLYFVQNGDITTLEEFPSNLDKAKLRMDNLVIPLHFEFGPSKKVDKTNYYRYSTQKKFKFGIGGYVGFNLGTRQKLKYSEGGDNHKDKLKKSYNTNNFIYGLSSYIGVGDCSLYVKYDLNTIFNDPNRDENNISLGFRFEI